MFYAQSMSDRDRHAERERDSQAERGETEWETDRLREKGGETDRQEKRREEKREWRES